MNQRKGDESEAEDGRQSPGDENNEQIERDGTDEDWYEYEHFEDAENAGNSKKRKVIFIAILLGVIGSTGFLLWFMNNKDRGRSDTLFPDQPTEQIESNGRPKTSDTVLSNQTSRQSETTVQQIKVSEHAAFGLVENKLEKSTRIRNKLLRKQEEIRALKRYYRNRIKEVKEEILKEEREKGITTFQEAVKNKRIELGLRTISRRHVYIRQLNGPLEQLHRGSEELLYIKRLAKMQIHMAPFVNGMNIAELEKRIDVIIEKEANGANSLAIDAGETPAPSLKKIWEEIVHEENKKEQPEKEREKEEKAYSQLQDKINSEIWQEICAGNLSRKHELTKVSLNAAKCLSQWEEGKDLFLNNMKELPASTAGQLSQWQGEWLCLNGLTELSPEAAGGLSHWRGSRLSLNGLIELTPQAAKHLSQWRGKQIEAMGLAIISFETDKYLTAWKRNGGELFIRSSP